MGWENWGNCRTVKATEPDSVLKIDILVELELLQDTLTGQAPGDIDELIVAVIMVSDKMSHDRVGILQTVAVQDCISVMKLDPKMLMVAPG